MMKKEAVIQGLLLLCGGLIHCALSKEKSPPTLLWYVPHSGIESRGDCKEHADSGDQVVEGGPVFVRPNETSICVYFSVPDKWFLHEGKLGPCAGPCCEWLPPLGPDGEFASPSPGIGVRWYELLEDEEECLDTPDVKEAPLVIEGKLGENKTVCTTLPEEDTVDLVKVSVTLTLCGGNCCIF